MTSAIQCQHQCILFYFQTNTRHEAKALLESQLHYILFAKGNVTCQTEACKRENKTHVQSLISACPSHAILKC